MIRFATAYDFDKRIFEAIDREMMLCKSPSDWVCLTDGDTLFLQPHFGHIIQQYTEQHPCTGMFTCYASRCHYSWQLPPGADMNNPDILFHRQLAKTLETEFAGKSVEIDRAIAGHLMVIRHGVWLAIRNKVKNEAASKKLLGVDTKISRAILGAGLKIRLMQSLYVLHYLRMAEGLNNTKHLQ